MTMFIFTRATRSSQSLAKRMVLLTYRKHQTPRGPESRCLQLHSRALAEPRLNTATLPDTMRRLHLFRNLLNRNRRQSPGAPHRPMSPCQAMIPTQGVPPTPAMTLLQCTGQLTSSGVTNGAPGIGQASKCEPIFSKSIDVRPLTFNIGMSPHDARANPRLMLSLYLTKRASYR